MLLVPTGLVAGLLLWNFVAGRELGAALIGLSVLPTILGVRARNPGCAAASEFASCDPGPLWPWIVGALLLAITGLMVLVSGRLRFEAAVASSTEGDSDDR